MGLITKKSSRVPTWLGLVIIALAVAVFYSARYYSQRNIRETAYKAEEWNDLTIIAKAYAKYTNGKGTPRRLITQTKDTTHTVAGIFAREYGLNDASFWRVGFNETMDGNMMPIADTLNTTAAIYDDFAHLPLSFDVAANITLDAPPKTTPIAWTTGLQSDGTWPSASPWRGQGGHIAFLDGHVDWFEKADFVKYGTNIPTINIREALPPGAVILSAEPAGK